jgi:aminoglycoside phosphotransferase (APT) family kinase protein
LGFLESHRVLGFNWLTGDNLNGIILADDIARVLLGVKNAGAALAELHSQEVVGLPCRRRDSEITTLSELSERLGFLCPQLAEKSLHLVQLITNWLATEPITYQPIHGDFYSKQVLVDNDQIGIVDLDEAVLGDFRADLGLFIAHVEFDVVRGLLSADLVKPLLDALLTGYKLVTGESVPIDLDVYIAIGLFQLSHHSFRHCESDWSIKTKAILDKVEMYINKSSIKKFKRTTNLSINQKKTKQVFPWWTHSM